MCAQGSTQGTVAFRDWSVFGVGKEVALVEVLRKQADNEEDSVSRIRRIISITLVLCLSLGLLSGVGSARAATGGTLPTRQEVLALKEAYLKGKTPSAAVSGKVVKDTSTSDDDAMLAGVRVPPEVLSGLKNASTLEVIITIPGAISVAQYVKLQGTSISRLTAGDAAPVIAAERNEQAGADQYPGQHDNGNSC